jgi:hypothetical protein
VNENVCFSSVSSVGVVRQESICSLRCAHATLLALLYIMLNATLKVTVSGHSAGGNAAIQHLFAHSSSVEAALIAGGSPYGCGSVPSPNSACFYGLTSKQLDETVTYTRQREADGLIDPLSNLKRTPVLLFAGMNDWVVYEGEMEQAATQVKMFVDRQYVSEKFDTNAGHVWSVDHGSCRCGACAYGFGETSECCDVNNCKYDMSGAFLRMAYGQQLAPRKTASAELRWIDQFNYLPSAWVDQPLGGAAAGLSATRAGKGPSLRLPQKGNMLQYAIALSLPEPPCALSLSLAPRPSSQVRDRLRAFRVLEDAPLLPRARQLPRLHPDQLERPSALGQQHRPQ